MQRDSLKMVSWTSLLVVIILLLSSLQVVAAQQALIQSASVQLTVGDTLTISSNRTSISRVFVEGNLSYASIKKPAQYPANDFAISANVPRSYALRVFFDNSKDYQINLVAQTENSSLPLNNSTYYVSSGPFELDVKATFNPRADLTAVGSPSETPWQGFVSWLGSFGEAFPIWVKIVYLASNH